MHDLFLPLPLSFFLLSRSPPLPPLSFFFPPSSHVPAQRQRAVPTRVDASDCETMTPLPPFSFRWPLSPLSSFFPSVAMENRGLLQTAVRAPSLFSFPPLPLFFLLFPDGSFPSSLSFFSPSPLGFQPNERRRLHGFPSLLFPF